VRALPLLVLACNAPAVDPEPIYAPIAESLEVTGDHDDVCADCDGDGYTRDVDCDDQVATVNPGMRELPGFACIDGLDNDCDGRVDDAHPECPLPPVCDAQSCSVGLVEVSACAGIEGRRIDPVADYRGAGVAWGDVDGDGWQDLYLTSNDGPNTLFHNERDGTFSLMAPGEHSVERLESGGAIFADYDNDGWTDLYVLNHGPNVLVRNVNGRFTDVTSRVGGGDPGMGQSATWGDYDGDGDLDLYVVNWDCEFCSVPYDPDDASDRLYENDGGTLRDVTHLLGRFPPIGLGYAAVWYDADLDGDVDLYVINDKGGPGPDQRPMIRAVFFRNDGPGCGGWCFTENAVETGADLRIQGMGLVVGDVDNDGDIDMVATDEGPPVVLLRDTSGLYFVSPGSMALSTGVYTWGLSLLDYDLDGWLDLYVASFANGRDGNYLLHNDRGVFAPVPPPTAPGHDTYGTAVADYDKDGRVDVAIGTVRNFHLYRNPRAGCVSEHFLRVVLAGGGPVNRDAVGSIVRVQRSDGLELMQPVVAGGSMGSGSELALTFGLGDAEVDAVTVTWPDGTVSTVTDVWVDQELQIAYPVAP
jgi:hypothetical protein